MANEIWKEVPGYEGNYIVSNSGSDECIVGLNYENTGEARPIKQKYWKDTFRKYVKLYNKKENKVKHLYVYQVIAKAFVYNDDPVNKTEVHHIDFDVTNNKPENLMWCTPSEHRRLHGYKSYPVACYKDNKLIKVYPSPSAARKDGFPTCSVQRVCQGKQSLCKGHFFKYITEEDFNK